MYIVVRTWDDAGAIADAMLERTQEVKDLLKAVPGFHAYYATRDGGSLTSVTICDSREGTQESTKRATEWVKKNVSSAMSSAPTISEGETFINI